MLSVATINKIIGVDESFLAPIELQKILNDSTKRVKVFREFLKHENNLNFDWFTDYF